MATQNISLSVVIMRVNSAMGKNLRNMIETDM